MSRISSFTSSIATSFDSETFSRNQHGHAYSGSPESTSASDDLESPENKSEIRHTCSYALPDSMQQAYSEDPATGRSLAASAAPRDPAPSSGTAVASFPITSDPAASDGYLATRRSAPSLHRSFSAQPMPPPRLVQDVGRSLKKSASFVRLSMNAEGKAEVTTKDASSPSPPRPPQMMILPEASLRLDTAPELPPPNALPRTSSGRSRDSRSWEFWCDRDARSELGTAAERDAVGSAAGAIGLLRTASGRSILSSIPNKRNSPFADRTAPAKQVKRARSSLQRSSTAGELQVGKAEAQVSQKLKHSESADYVRSTDSDKENCSPARDVDSDSETPATARRFTQVSRGRQPRLASMSGNSRQGMKHGAGSQEDALDPETDAEVAAFMHGSEKGNARSAGDELDCVQGLLSLSQGNWR